MARSKPNVPLMTLFFVLFVTSVGFGLVIPILPLIAREFGASAGMLGLMTASYSAVQFLFAPVWGQVSDRTGRKKVLLLGITGLALSFVFYGTCPQLLDAVCGAGARGLLEFGGHPHRPSDGRRAQR